MVSTKGTVAPGCAALADPRPERELLDTTELHPCPCHVRSSCKHAHVPSQRCARHCRGLSGGVNKTEQIPGPMNSAWWSHPRAAPRSRCVDPHSGWHRACRRWAPRGSSGCPGPRAHGWRGERTHIHARRTPGPPLPADVSRTGCSKLHEPACAASGNPHHSASASASASTSASASASASAYD